MAVQVSGGWPGRRRESVRIHSYYLICPVLDRCRPLRFPQRKTWYPQDRCFFLYSARISEHDTRAVVERKKIQITQRIERHNSNALFTVTIREILHQTEAFDIFTSSRMNGKKTGKELASDFTAARMPCKVLGSSTLDGRCRVSTA